jgi:hypothetical protein
MCAVSPGEKKKSTRVLLPDADVLGFSAALFVAGGVAAVALFWLQLSAFDTLFRAALTFAVTYAAVFVFVKYVVWTILTDIATKRRRDFEIQRQAMEASSSQGPRVAEHEPGEAEK